MKYMESKEGETIFEMGELGDLFYIILTGQVGIKVENKSIPVAAYKKPKMIEVKVLSCGDSFGELALLKKIPRYQSFN